MWFEELAIYLVEISDNPSAHAGTIAFFVTPNESSPYMFRPKPHSKLLFSEIYLAISIVCYEVLAFCALSSVMIGQFISRAL